ncbi:hypothetical protein JYU34_020528 [Plutella xylostella]|uniref:Uncharacterized protein n=1 Tax=Plutella xylostella TaxID=51655 RepID=A0ABQ7PUP1_PLUXY|nr:hypothetical protein JYU34_020528 [Plutella xylostella]
MVRVITQDTYDEVVKENIDEFDMEPEEAMKEAIAQFEAQGVDLCLIIKDLALTPGDKHLVAVTVDKLKELCVGETVEDELVLKQLEVLRAECEKDLARRIRAGKEGAYDILIKLLEARYKMYQKDKSENDAAFIVSVLNTLAALMDIQPDLLEIKGIDLINSMLSSVTNEDILVPLLKWTCVCCVRHEMNRQNLFSKDMIENIKRLLDNQKNRKILSGTLHLVRVFTLDDDIRVEFGKAHDHSKELGAQLIEKLSALLKENPSPSLLSELMLTMSSLLVRNELCAMAADSADTLLAAISDNCGAAATAAQGCRL